MTDTILTTRNATVADLAAVLQAQHTAKLDNVTPPSASSPTTATYA